MDRENIILKTAEKFCSFTAPLTSLGALLQDLVAFSIHAITCLIHQQVLSSQGDFNSPGREMLTMVSNSKFPCSVDSPISGLPVAATSNRQNWSPLHIATAWASISGEAKPGEKVGTKRGSKNVSKDDASSYVNKLSSVLLTIPRKLSKILCCVNGY